MSKMSALMEGEAGWSEDSLPNTAGSELGHHGGGRQVCQGRLGNGMKTHDGQATEKVASNIRRELYLFV